MIKDRFRTSWVAFVLALLAVASIPLVATLFDDGQIGLARLVDWINAALLNALVAVALLAVSSVSGWSIRRQRKIVLLWVVPSGVIVLFVAVGLLAHGLGVLVEWY